MSRKNRDFFREKSEFLRDRLLLLFIDIARRGLLIAYEYFASELEQVPEPVELKFLVIVEFDEAMCRPDDDRLIYMVKQALENNSIDIYRGLQNPIITFSIQAIDNK